MSSLLLSFIEIFSQPSKFHQRSATTSVMKNEMIAIIVAHPDDETLWAGGTILSHPSWKCFIVSLCRKNDPDRAPKYYKMLEFLRADGSMADLDDAPEQKPLENEEV